MTALIVPIAGPYNATMAGTPLGQTEDGWTVVQQVSKETVRGDGYGDSILDAVYRGGNVSVIATGIEASKAAAAAWPYGVTAAVMGQVGRMDVASNLAGIFVMSAVAGTPAASAPATWTGGKTSVDDSYRNEQAYASRLRRLPLGLRCYPYTNGGGIVWFVTG